MAKTRVNTFSLICPLPGGPLPTYSTSFFPLIRCDGHDKVSGILISHALVGQKQPRVYFARNLSVKSDVLMLVFQNVTPGDYTFIASQQGTQYLLRIDCVKFATAAGPAALAAGVVGAAAAPAAALAAAPAVVPPRFLLTIDVPGGPAPPVGLDFNSQGTSDYNTITDVSITSIPAGTLMTYTYTVTVEPSAGGGEWVVYVEMDPSTPTPARYELQVTDDGGGVDKKTITIDPK